MADSVTYVNTALTGYGPDLDEFDFGIDSSDLQTICEAILEELGAAIEDLFFRKHEHILNPSIVTAEEYVEFDQKMIELDEQRQQFNRFTWIAAREMTDAQRSTIVSAIELVNGLALDANGSRYLSIFQSEAE